MLVMLFPLNSYPKRFKKLTMRSMIIIWRIYLHIQILWTKHRGSCWVTCSRSAVVKTKHKTTLFGECNCIWVRQRTVWKRIGSGHVCGDEGHYVYECKNKSKVKKE